MDAKMEILAPAGDVEMLRAAVFSGADCVYLGVQGFNARRTAANFANRALEEAVAFCHARGCGVYAALNTIVLPGEEGGAAEAVKEVAAAGCDAAIVQDLATAALVQKLAPGLPLHASTQMSVHSAAGVRAMAAFGFARVILAREVRFDEIEQIAAVAKEAGIELEVFVHGALCVCVSGQCYMSAFLGGRSANRGACAGCCRLPFSAAQGGAPQRGAAAGEYHLSLKDLSILHALPALQKAGVASAKIEGRLRGPEYGAVVVNAAQKALRGQPYDETLVRDIFSRSGFTQGWFTGEGAGEMFGVRTAADTEAARRALPKARELYRREMPRVPVDMALTLQPGGARLTATDGTHTVQATLPGPLAPAQKEVGEALQKGLGKTGGTPFLVQKVQVEANGLHAPGAPVNALRRQLLNELLALRAQNRPLRPLPPRAAPGFGTAAKPPALRAASQNAGPALRARFENVAQMPPEAAALCQEILLPLREAQKVPVALRHKTRLWLPRILFPNEEPQVQKQLDTVKSMGFLGCEANNYGHLWLCRGLPVSAGFGLNVANALAAARLGWAGCGVVTLSVELRLAQMRDIVRSPTFAGGALQSDMLCYGHMPVMVTRACPLLGAGRQSCTGCPRAGHLQDRKGVAFALRCAGDIAGVRTIYNPIPLWMADRLQEAPTRYATLYFTTEDVQQAGEVLRAFAARRAATGAFTRGLYYKGVQANPQGVT